MSMKHYARLCLVLAVMASASRAEEVTVKTYRVSGGDKVSAEVWPSKLLMRLRKTDMANPTSTNTAVVFTNSRKTIAIKYSGRKAKDKKGQEKFAGQFGWVPPTCNWYHDGFFHVTLNGKKSLQYPFQLLESKGGDRGGPRRSGALLLLGSP